MLMVHVPRPKGPDEWAWLMFLDPSAIHAYPQLLLMHIWPPLCLQRAGLGPEVFTESKSYGKRKGGEIQAHISRRMFSEHRRGRVSHRIPLKLSLILTRHLSFH